MAVSLLLPGMQQLRRAVLAAVTGWCSRQVLCVTRTAVVCRLVTTQSF